jgi:SIR2-like domain
MDKVVYILGAGFSAPLGLPVISNFIDKAKELYAFDREKYKHFESVFRTVRAMGHLKTFFNVDLENIEEVLSILQMDEYLGEGKIRHEFERMICDVINYYTPPIPRVSPGSLHPDFQTQPPNWRLYLYFVASLFQVKLDWGSQDRNESSLALSLWQHPVMQYSVVTLNYDRVLELGLQFIKEHYNPKVPIEFVSERAEAAGATVPLAKLHGCVSTGTIMPPTWNKYLNDKCQPGWELAYALLSEANHVRILGYSLPPSDAYVRYLLKSGLQHAEHLKTIDVACIDSGRVRDYERALENRLQGSAVFAG